MREASNRVFKEGPILRVLIRRGFQIKKFLFFTDDYKPQPGGIAEYALQVAKHFAESGQEVLMLAPDAEGGSKFDRKQAFHTKRVPNARLIGIAVYFVYFFYTVLNQDIDYVYNVMWFPCGLISVLLKPIFNYKIITAVHAHESVYTEETTRQKLKKIIQPIQAKAFNRMTYVFAVSNFTRDNLIKIGVMPKKIKVFKNGVDLRDFQETGKHNEIIRKYSLEDKSVILTVSRLVERKGHDMVIKTMHEVIDKVSDAIYLIAGTGPYRSELEKIVEERDLKDRVVFLGFVPDEEINRLYNTCDVFIMPSRRVGISVEGFGIVFLEANACKKPVIGGNSGGIPDAIVDGKTGLLVDPENLNDIAEALIRLLSNKDLAMDMGENGYERIKKELTWNKVATKMLRTLTDQVQ